jgi:N-acetyl-gamma-glutamyl-phosphate reductase common form
MSRTMDGNRPRVGIFGASGYMGGEALRVLLEHPQLDLAWATSRTPGPAHHHHPNLLGAGVDLIHPDEATPCDAVLVALPTEASIDVARRFVDAGTRVVDLGAAFRLSHRDTWEEVYGQRHSDWALAEEAVYGIPELHEHEIRDARLVANPGCFSSAAILALAPLLKEGIVDPTRLFVDGISGTTGVGAELWRGAHHPEIGNNLVPYNACGHRHSFEMEQELGLVAGDDVTVHFTPVYAPIVRGILDVCHGLLEHPLRRDDALELFREFYRDAPFVCVHDSPHEPGAAFQYRPYPWVSAVAGTNYAFIGLEVDERRGRIVVFGALDSIGKGGALVGIENLNGMLGLPRESGLSRRGLHPA